MVAVSTPNSHFQHGNWTGSEYSAGVNSPSFLPYTPAEQAVASVDQFDFYSKTHDIAYAQAQQDLVANLANNMTIREAGANYINVQNGGNSVVSGSGNDSIDAGSGNDTINAGDGNNRILVYGTDGIAHITTGLGNDNIIFYHGVVNAGDGANYIESSGFNNTITGGSGDDTVAMTGNGDGDSINLGGGNNNLYVAGATFEIGGNTVYAGNGNDTISIWYQYHSGTYADNSRQDAYGRPAILAVKYEIHEEQAAWVKKIFEWWVSGKSYRSIAFQLNALGVPSSRGSTWAVSAVKVILENDMYRGQVIWNRKQWLKDPDTGKRLYRKRPESEWIVTPAPELAIISSELWEASLIRLA